MREVKKLDQDDLKGRTPGFKRQSVTQTLLRGCLSLTALPHLFFLPSSYHVLSCWMIYLLVHLFPVCLPNRMQAPVAETLHLVTAISLHDEQCLAPGEPSVGICCWMGGAV